MKAWRVIKTGLEVWQVQGFRTLFKKTKRLFFSEDYNYEMKKVIKQFSNGQSVFIDVGAGVGHIVLDVSKYFKKNICFEPSSKNFIELESKILEKKLKNIVAHNFALGKEGKNSKFYLSKANKWDSSLYVSSKKNFEICDMRVEKLDNIIEPKSDEHYVIKMDVQGAELDVILGAKKLLEHDCVIISEFWPWGLALSGIDPYDFYNHMKNLDYEFFDFDLIAIKENDLKNFCNLGRNKKHLSEDFVIMKRKFS